MWGNLSLYIGNISRVFYAVEFTYSYELLKTTSAVTSDAFSKNS